MGINKTYQDKCITAEAAVRLVNDNDIIVTGLGCSEARSFLENIHLVLGERSGISLNNCLPMQNYQFMQAEYAAHIYVNGWFYSPAMRQMHQQGNASFIPNNLHFAALKRLHHLSPAVYVGVCTPPDEHGYVSLSLGNTYEKRMIEAARLVILEANPNFPRTFGDVELPLSEVDYFIPVTYDVPELPSIEPSAKDTTIGKLIADEIQDGACLQIGIGGIPNAVARFLYDKKDLGVHTEMLTSELARLAAAGVITGKRKSLHKGKIVTTFIMGDKFLYDFVDNNTSVLVLDGYYVNHPHTIAQNEGQVSINTTLEVDLSGQCASESLGSRQYSGTGGQTDTVRGAQEAKGGCSYIALYSTALVRNSQTGVKEEVSKIVCQLKEGAVVSLSRNDTDNVVTEFGIARLRGTTVAERAERLIAVAHPKFREQLWKEALASGLIGSRRLN